MVNPFFPSCPRVTVWLWVTTCGDNIRSLNLRPCVTTGLSQMAPVPVKSPFSETSFLSNELKEQGRLPVPIRGWGCPYQDGPKEKPSTYPRFWAKVAMRAGLGMLQGNFWGWGMWRSRWNPRETLPFLLSVSSAIFSFCDLGLYLTQFQVLDTMWDSRKEPGSWNQTDLSSSFGPDT